MSQDDFATERAASGGGDSRLRHLRRMASEKIRERPLLAAGLTAAAGFVIGGGLTSGTALRAMRRSVGLALQMAVIPVLISRLKDSLLGEVES